MLQLVGRERCLLVFPGATAGRSVEIAARLRDGLQGVELTTDPRCGPFAIVCALGLDPADALTLNHLRAAHPHARLIVSMRGVVGSGAAGIDPAGVDRMFYKGLSAKDVRTVLLQELEQYRRSGH